MIFFGGEIAWFTSYGTLLQTVLLRDQNKQTKKSHIDAVLRKSSENLKRPI